jgi:hypothetical protein
MNRQRKDGEFMNKLTGKILNSKDNNAKNLRLKSSKNPFIQSFETFS